MRAFPLILLAAGALVASTCAPVGDCYSDSLDQRSCTAPAEEPSIHLRDYRQADKSLRPAVGSAIPELRTLVVSAVDTYLEPTSNASLDNIWVQERFNDPNFQGCPTDAAGYHVCGMQLFNVTLVPSGTHLMVGDIVTIAGGQYDEFTCATCGNPPSPFTNGHSLPEFEKVSVQRSGSGAEPEPVPARLLDIINGNDLYLGVLVRITDDVTLGTYNAMRGEYDLNSQFQLDETMTPMLDPATGQHLPSGTKLRNLVGIASYFYKFKIYPRTVHDYEVVP